MPTCPECHEENPERARFCLACAHPLPAPDEPRRERRKTITAVFCDITGSTELGEQLDAETLRGVMARYYREMRAAIEHHGGTVEKFIGDAVMASFGVPVQREDDALRAVRAALEMRTRLAGLNEELAQRWSVTIRTRTGVNTGEVVVAEAESDENFAVGDPVNVAARLEQAAEPGQILIGPRTYRLVRDAIDAAPVEPLVLKGKSQRVDAYRLDGLRSPDGAGAGAGRLGSEMVGRDTELAILRSAFAEATQQRTRRAVTVLGAAGIGKSRLTREFIAGVGADARVVRGRCLSYGDGLTFWPVAEVLRQLASIDESEDAAVAREKLTALLPGADDATFVLDRLAGVLGLGVLEARQEEIFWAVRRVLETAAATGPLVVVFDDVHWGEASFLELLDYLVTRVDGAIMLLLLARPELRDSHPSLTVERPGCRVVALEPLAVDDSRRLIEALLKDADLGDELAARILEAAEGNPLFVEEMLRMLVDEGHLQPENGRWRLTGPVSSVTVPPTIEALLGARLDRLRPDERAIVERASVVGKVFWQDAVAELSPPPARPQLDFYLDTLVGKELIRADTSAWNDARAFRFRHILMRDAAYQAMLKELRADLHERVAAWLERKTGAGASDYAELVGHHLEQAYRLREQLGPLNPAVEALARRAANQLAAAGARALTRSDMPAAAGILERAVALLPADALERAHLMLGWSIALKETGQYSRADGLLDDVIDAAARAGDRGLEWHARVEQATQRFVTDAHVQTEWFAAVAREAIGVFEALGDERGQAKAWRLLSVAPIIFDRWVEATEMLVRALGHAERAGDRLEASQTLEILNLTALWGPALEEEALAPWKAAIAADDPATQALLLVMRGYFAATSGDFSQARALRDRGMTTLDEMGLRFLWGSAAYLSGEIELLAGEHAAAEAEYRVGFDTHLELGARAWVPSFAMRLAQCLAAQGRDRQASRFERVAENSGRPDDVRIQVELRIVRGVRLARDGEPDRAEAILREAHDLAATTQSPNLQGDSLLALAEFLADRGDPHAADLAHEAEVTYESRGNVVGAENARALQRRSAVTGVAIPH